MDINKHRRSISHHRLLNTGGQFVVFILLGRAYTHSNNHRTQLGLQRLPSTQVNCTDPDPKPVHVNESLSPNLQRALEHDQSEFNKLFLIYPAILLQPNRLCCLLRARTAGTYYTICWWQFACCETRARAGLQKHLHAEKSHLCPITFSPPPPPRSLCHPARSHRGDLRPE